MEKQTTNVREFNAEELKALTEDLQEVLIKHNATMGVTSTINLMKVIEKKDGEQQQETNAETDAEESSRSGGEESSK